MTDLRPRSETNNETFGPSRRVRDSRTTRNERTPSPSPSRRATRTRPTSTTRPTPPNRTTRFRRSDLDPDTAHEGHVRDPRGARPPFEWPSDPIVPVANGGQWRELADALAAEASNATTELVLVGDSITEAWRGTSFERGPRGVRVGAGDFGAAPRRVRPAAGRRRGHDGKRAVATQERGLSDTETTRKPVGGRRRRGR